MYKYVHIWLIELQQMSCYFIKSAVEYSQGWGFVYYLLTYLLLYRVHVLVQPPAYRYIE